MAMERRAPHVDVTAMQRTAALLILQSRKDTYEHISCTHQFHDTAWHEDSWLPQKLSEGDDGMCVKATTLQSHHAIKINKTSYLPGTPFPDEERVGAPSDGCSRPSRATIKSEHRSSKCSRLKKEKQQPDHGSNSSHPSKTCKPFQHPVELPGI